MAARDIVVIGASAGGYEAIRTIAAGLPIDLPAAVFVTIHFADHRDGILPAAITKAGSLQATYPMDGEQIEHGRIYVAPPDYHLRLSTGHVELSHGPRENLQRPCINAMFRSAAAAYGERVSGVLLTGMLDDGAAGLWEIQQKNGASIVQDPEEATFRSMPDSAIRGMNVQYIMRLKEIAPLVTRLAMADGIEHSKPSQDKVLIQNTFQTCPECGGAMSATKMGQLREYQCHVGHRFGLRTMIAEKANNIDRLLEMALAQSEELSELLKNSLEDAGSNDTEALTEALQRREREQEMLRSLSRDSNQTVYSI